MKRNEMHFIPFYFTCSKLWNLGIFKKWNLEEFYFSLYFIYIFNQFKHNLNVQYI